MAPAEPVIPLNTSYISDYPTQPSLKRLQHNFGSHPASTRESLQHLGKCHVESFNFMLTDGLKLAIEDLEKVEFQIPETGARVGEQDVYHLSKEIPLAQVKSEFVFPAKVSGYLTCRCRGRVWCLAPWGRPTRMFTPRRRGSGAAPTRGRSR